MFNVNPNYNEIALKQMRQEYVPYWAQRKENFLQRCHKVCPKCGAFLSLRAKGCDNCLFQFDNRSRESGR